MNTVHILIVDDERNIRLMLRTALYLEGYTVTEASNGQEALDAIRQHVPDMMVLDLNMPVVDGMTVLEQLKPLPPEQKPRVIVLTAYGSIPAAVKATRLGALDFLEKPVTPEELRQAVAGGLEEPPVQSGQEPDLSYSAALTRVRQNLWRGDLRHAEAMLMKAAELAGNDPSYFNLLGVLHEAEGRTNLARKFYGKAIRANHRYEPAQQNMRRLYELQTFGHTREEVALGDEAELLTTFSGTVGHHT